MSTTIDHAERASRINSTDVAAIMGLAPRLTAWEVWAQKRGILEPWPGNAATDAGLMLEPPLLDLAEEELGPLERQVRCEAEGLDFPLSATIDGRVLATREIVEAKTSGIVGPVYGEWGDAGTDAIPLAYLVQVSVGMLCAQVDFEHVYALLGGRGVVRYRVNRDEEVIRTIVEQAGRWWQRHIVEGVEPDRTTPVPLEVAKRLRKVPAKTIALADSDMDLVARWEAAKAAKRAAEKAADALQSEVLLRLGDAEEGALPDGRSLTNFAQVRRGYVVEESSYRVLRISKGK